MYTTCIADIELDQMSKCMNWGRGSKVKDIGLYDVVLQTTLRTGSNCNSPKGLP